MTDIAILVSLIVVAYGVLTEIAAAKKEILKAIEKGQPHE